MADDPTNPFAAILGSLKGRGDSKSTKGVLPDGSKKGDVNPILTHKEIARYSKIFGVMKDVMNPEEEAKVVGKTKTGKAGGDTISQMLKAGDVEGDGLMNTIGTVIAGLALAGSALGVALWAMVDDVEVAFKDLVLGVTDFGAIVASDIGHLPAMAAKLARLIPWKVLKVMPLIGSLINFGMAKIAFEEGNIAIGMWELASGVIGLFPQIGGPIISAGMDMIMFMYEGQNPKDEKTGKRDMSFGDWLWNKTKEIGVKIWQNVVDGKVPLISGLYKFGEGLGYMAIGEFGKGFESWSAIIPAMLGQGDNENFLMAFDAFTDMLGEDTHSLYVSAKKKLKDEWGWLPGVFEHIGEVFQTLMTSLKDSIMEEIDKGFDRAKRRLKVITDAPGKMMDSVWNAGRDLLGGGGPTNKQYHGEVEDGFISKDGRVTRFDDRDSILAVKSGGPIDKLLDDNSLVMSELNDVNRNQLSVLASIRDGINILVSNAGSSTVMGGSPATGGSAEVQFTTNPLTQEFYA